MSEANEETVDLTFLQITQEEIDALLEQSHPCVLSIARQGRGPIATPLWYEYRDGKFILGMDENSAKARLLARTGRATITVQRPIEPYQFVMVEGEAHILTDDELAARGETVWTCFRPVVERYLENDVVERYMRMLPVLAPAYKIVEITPKSIRGESIPRHDDAIPKAEEIDAILASLEAGQTSVEAALDPGASAEASGAGTT